MVSSSVLPRRSFLGNALFVAGIGIMPGCVGPSKPAEVTDTRIVYDDGRIGVLVSLRDTDPNETGPVEIHAELLAAEEVIAEDTKEVRDPPEGGGSYVVWFDDLSDSDKDRIDGARAEVIS